MSGYTKEEIKNLLALGDEIQKIAKKILDESNQTQFDFLIQERNQKRIMEAAAP